MKKTFLILLFALGGFCAAQTSAPPALSISGAACIPAGSAGHTYSLSAPSLTGAGYEVISSQWEAFGGITINGSANTPTVTVDSKNDKTYLGQFSKYGKGKLLLKATLEKRTPVNLSACGCDSNLCEAYEVCTKELFAEFDICKIFSIPDGDVTNEIVGPACISPGETVTYSVAPWVSLAEPGKVGFDDYNWFPDNSTLPSFVANGVLYYSADKSSITFVVGEISNETDNAISVQIGRCNNAANTTLTLPLKKAIPAPVITPTDCVASGRQTVSFSIQNPMEDVEYTWSIDGNWGINGPKTGNSVTVETDDINAAYICVEANYKNGVGCKPVTSRTKILRTLKSNAAIYGGQTSCYTSGTEYSFTLEPAPSPASFHWEVPSGWEVTSPEQTLATIRLMPTDNSKPTDTLRVSVDGCGTDVGAKPWIELKRRPGNAAGIEISGTASCLERGGTYTFTTDDVTPAPERYEWNLGSSWTPSSGTGTSITATAAENAVAAPVRVTPMGKNGCNGAASSLQINYSPILKGISVSKDCINSGMEDQITLTADGDDFDSYEWTIDESFGTIVGSRNKKSITVDTDGTAGTYNVSVKGGNNSCDVEISKSTNIVIPNDERNIYYEQKYRLYCVDDPIESDYNDYSYTWTLVSNGIPIVLESTISSVQISQLSDIAGSTQYLLICDILSADGCIVRKTYGQGAMPTETLSQKTRGITPQSISAKDSSIIEDINNIKLSIAPNPTSNVITGYLNDYSSSELKLEVFSANGKKMISTETDNRFFSLDASTLRPGLYIVIANCNGKSYQEKVILK